MHDPFLLVQPVHSCNVQMLYCYIPFPFFLTFFLSSAHLQIHGGGFVRFRGRLVVRAGGKRGRVSGDWGNASSFQPWDWANSLVRNTHTQAQTHTLMTQQTIQTFFCFAFVGMYCHYNQMFTSFCCMGLQSSTMTRTATSQLAVCCDCNLTTQHSPGVNHNR